MSVHEDEALRRRWRGTPGAFLARTLTRRRALQTVFAFAGVASRTPRWKRLERSLRTLRNHSGPRPVEGKVCAQPPRSRRTRSTRPDFLDVTMASAGVRAAPSRFRNVCGESTTAQLRFGFGGDVWRSKRSRFETRYGSEPPHLSTEAAVLPPFEEEKYALITSPPDFRTSPAVALTAAVEPGSSPVE